MGDGFASWANKGFSSIRQNLLRQKDLFLPKNPPTKAFPQTNSVPLADIDAVKDVTPVIADPPQNFKPVGVVADPLSYFKSDPRATPDQLKPSNYIPANLTGSSSGSFSGADFRIFAVVTSTESPIENFPTIQTLSYSTFRESMSVRALGQVSERGRTRGPRTIAGSMVFTLIGDHPFAGFSNHVVQTTKDYATTRLFYNDLTDSYETGSLDGVNTFKQTEVGLVQTDFNQLVDTLPPFDIIISGANDLGFMVQANLFGVRLHAEGAVFSIHDIYTEITCQYTATDMIPLRAVKRDTNGFGPEELLYNKARLGNMPTTFDRVVKEDLETSNKYLQITRNPYL